LPVVCDPFSIPAAFLRKYELGGSVERLAELHDVQPALAEGRADWRRRVRLAGRNMQLDDADDFLCHELNSIRS